MSVGATDGKVLGAPGCPDADLLPVGLACVTSNVVLGCSVVFVGEAVGGGSLSEHENAVREFHTIVTHQGAALVLSSTISTDSFDSFLH